MRSATLACTSDRVYSSPKRGQGHRWSEGGVGMRQYSLNRLLRGKARARSKPDGRNITANSTADRIIAIMNIAVSALLSITAIYFALEYNEREDKRAAEVVARERADGQAREERDRRLARAECVNFDIALASRQPFAHNEPLRLALAQSIEYHVAECAIIGHRVDKSMALRVLASLADDTSERVRKGVAIARASVARERPARVTSQDRREASGRLAGTREGNQRLTLGYGVNWDSPFGPFRIDVARAINSAEAEDEAGNRLQTFNVGTAF